MNVGVVARFKTGISGGVEQVVIGLAHGLSSLKPEGDLFQFVTTGGEDDWLHPYVSGPCSIFAAPSPAPRRFRGGIKRALPHSRRLAEALPRLPGVRIPRPSDSDGTLENLGVDVVHFSTQDAVLTEIPSIYQPHDLLHLHHPEFLTRRQLAHRAKSYPMHCERATFVVAMTTWGKQDLEQRLGLPPDKVRIIPWAPVVSAYEVPKPDASAAVARRYGLPSEYVFYPAQTWPHKNHLGLLDALAVLRDRDGLRVKLVCSGLRNEHFPRIAHRMDRLRLGDQVKFVDFVPPEDMPWLYTRAKGLIFPSYFEGWGMPVCEAFASGLPVACSTSTSLPDLAGDAALLFDPRDPEAIAHALARLWEDEDLRADLVARGRERAEALSWKRSARLMRVLYREASGTPLTQDDRSLLEEPILV